MLHYVLIHLILIRIFTPVALIALANAKPPGVARSAYPFLLLGKHFIRSITTAIYKDIIITPTKKQTTQPQSTQTNYNVYTS